MVANRRFTMYIQVILLGAIVNSATAALFCERCAEFDYSKTGLTWAERQNFPTEVEGWRKLLVHFLLKSSLSFGYLDSFFVLS